MTDIFSNGYLSWLMDIVCDEDHRDYTKLLYFLYNTVFYWSVKMDEDRAANGIYLRKTFADQYGYSTPNLDDPCRVLEMMVSLSINCSEDILSDGINNYTPFVFWSMIDNLGLSGMNDINYNEAYCDEKVHIFLDRKYDENGDGNLFKVSHFPKNFKNLEIWYQMHYWISENFE